MLVKNIAEPNISKSSLLLSKIMNAFGDYVFFWLLLHYLDVKSILEYFKLLGLQYKKAIKFTKFLYLRCDLAIKFDNWWNKLDY